MLFYLVIFGPIVFWIVAAMTWFAFVGKVTEKLTPKLPPTSETPEEKAAREARLFKMLAQAEKSRLAAHQI